MPWENRVEAAALGVIDVFAAKNLGEALSFRVVDPWLARVYVDAGEPEGWRIRLLPLPWRVPGGLLSTACFADDRAEDVRTGINTLIRPRFINPGVKHTHGRRR